MLDSDLTDCRILPAECLQVHHAVPDPQLDCLFCIFLFDRWTFFLVYSATFFWVEIMRDGRGRP